MSNCTKLVVFGRAEESAAITERHVSEALGKSFGKFDLRVKVRALLEPGGDLDDTSQVFFEARKPVIGGGPMNTLVVVSCEKRAGLQLDEFVGWAAQAMADVAAFPVEERVLLDGRVSALCRVGLVVRPPEMTRGEFYEYWTTHHAPLVLRHHPLFTRYAASRVLDENSPVDGIVEQWFVDAATLQEHDRINAANKPEIAEDIPRFVRQFQQFLAVESADDR